MDNSKIASEVTDGLAAAQFESRIVSVCHLKEVAHDITDLLIQRRVDSTFYSERLTEFRFERSQNLRGVKSIIVTAAAQPLIRVVFECGDSKIETFVPPTYSYDTDLVAKRTITRILRKYNFHLSDCILPVKVIAVRSGLAKYGRNNITYTDKFGSLFRLRAFYSDLEPVVDEWGEMKMTEKCERCFACVKACKAGAIDKSRFLIHAERCLTFHNERSCPFPVWLENKWHNCLIGCMHCQLICPLNKGRIIVSREIIAFDEHETAQILDSVPKEKISRSTRMKIKKLNLLGDFELLGRNLRVIVEQMIPSASGAKVDKDLRSLHIHDTGR